MMLSKILPPKSKCIQCVRTVTSFIKHREYECNAMLSCCCDQDNLHIFVDITIIHNLIWLMFNVPYFTVFVDYIHFIINVTNNISLTSFFQVLITFRYKLCEIYP